MSARDCGLTVFDHRDIDAINSHFDIVCERQPGAFLECNRVTVKQAIANNCAVGAAVRQLQHAVFETQAAMLP